MPEMKRITVRFPDEEILAITASAAKLGMVDRNGKPLLSTFIRRAIRSNKIYKTKLTNIRKILKESGDEPILC